MQYKIDINIRILSANNNDKEQIYKIDLKGDLNFNNYREFSEKFYDLIQKGIKKIIIDFNDLSGLDSTGIGTIINNARKLEKENGELIIVRCSEQILTILRPVNFERIIKIFKNLEDGINYFSNSEN